jgi:hypothetical protein
MREGLRLQVEATAQADLSATIRTYLTDAGVPRASFHATNLALLVAEHLR